MIGLLAYATMELAGNEKKCHSCNAQMTLRNSVKLCLAVAKL